MNTISKLWIIAITCMLCACLPLDRENDKPTITSVFPTTAMFHARTVFTIEGHHLPTTGDAYFLSAICDPATNRSPTGFTLVCFPHASDGQSALKVEGVLHPDFIITLSTDLTPSLAGVVLTDTGANAEQCYSAGSDALVNCASAEAIHLSPKQDGMHGRDVNAAIDSDGKLGFSYSTVGNYPISDCVHDNVTGLTWEGKPSEGPRNYKNRYTLRGDHSADDASTYVELVNAVGLCGYADWRLPTRDELMSLVDYSKAPKIDPSWTYYEADSTPTIDTNWFPNTDYSWYWTSTRALIFWQRPEQYNDFFWLVDFVYGQVFPGDGRISTESPHPVRLVRP